MQPRGELPSPGRRAALYVLLALAAAAPAWGTLDAGAVSDDAFALGYVHRYGPWADWFQSEYGSRIVRFWRPLITVTLGLQESWTGAETAPLRAFNIAGHALSAALVAALALRLRGGVAGAAVAGLLAAWFPHLGGNVVWIVGRVDSQAVPLVLAACVLALDRRVLLASLATFAACASKEQGFATPLWILALAWGRGDAPRRAIGVALVPGLVAAGAFVWRWLAIGTPTGGYLAGSPGIRPMAALQAWGAALWPIALFALVVFALSPARRAWLGASAASLLAAIPIYPTLAAGAVAATHQRTLWHADLGLCLAVGAAGGALSQRGGRAALLVAVLGLAGWRAADARADCVEWAEAGREADRLVAVTSEGLAELPDSDGPAFVDFPHARGGAYLFAWGVADRFEAPFEPIQDRPIWPLRPIFGGDAVARPMGDVGGGSPAVGFGRTWLDVPVLSFGTNGSGVLGPLRISEAMLAGPDRGADLLVGDGADIAALEVVVYTELGYLAAPLATGARTPRPPYLNPHFGVEGLYKFHTRDLLEAAGAGYAIFEAVAQAADVGAWRVWIEVRSLDPSTGEPLAVSAAVPLEFDDRALLDVVYPKWPRTP